MRANEINQDSQSNDHCTAVYGLRIMRYQLRKSELFIAFYLVDGRAFATISRECTLCYSLQFSKSVAI